MFFYLAKIFWFFAQPSGLLLVNSGQVYSLRLSQGPTAAQTALLAAYPD